MGVDEDIEMMEGLIKQAEEYVKNGAWEPEQHQEIVDGIIQAEDFYNRIISEYVEHDDMPPVMQAYRISELQQRIHNVKHNLPSPSPKPLDKSKTADKKAVIYTTPT